MNEIDASVNSSTEPSMALEEKDLSLSLQEPSISQLPKEAQLLMSGLVPKRRGRPPGAKNKSTRVVVEPNAEAFLDELFEVIQTWEKGPERPILYDFECSSLIKDMKQRHRL